jgi:hypothetical protein
VELVQAFASFGTDWLYVVMPSLIGLGIAAWLVSRAPAGGNALLRFADGAGQVTGLPSWAAGPSPSLSACS